MRRLRTWLLVAVAVLAVGGVTLPDAAPAPPDDGPGGIELTLAP